MSDLQMRPLGAPEVVSLRGVLAFAVLAHVADLITTHLRNPHLADEGNAFYTLAVSLGYGGWAFLVLVKVLLVSILGLAFWWYLGIRHHYLPDKIVRSPRSLIWYGMWDRKPYPKSMWARLFNARKIKYLGVVLAGIALPGSGAAALFISYDNVMCALKDPIPMHWVAPLTTLSVTLVFVWWYWAYWHYYREQVRLGLIRNP